ncbi:TetR family transcriptional regulator [Rhodococcus sp. 06-235-1A]|uniref:TetR/AcrR family transcriptional regulator n=1 Tax=Rhodococcus sp. 06-235-1A TaxID=2022508 RepID=UPI000B9C481B|nr:TetR/AcrR family transcriptional regulator [Rhodococcus sp. 06-235-1A]OZD04949.1 TetR family transcriptional regulator [Rhodococcus sp. 06-235-1A]
MPYRKSLDNHEVPEGRSGRPRDDRRESEILRVVNALLGEVGYDGVTFEGVARRAGASKSTLYRRWKTKREMVIAAIKAGPASRGASDVVDTGTLRGDVLVLCRRLVRTMADADGSMPLLLLQAGLEDPELCDEIERSVGPTGARLPDAVIAAAVERGELLEGTDPFPFDEVVGSVILLRRLNGLDLDDCYLEALVDSVVLPALRASAVHTDELPPGIFSGHPDRSSDLPEVKEPQ